MLTHAEEAPRPRTSRSGFRHFAVAFALLAALAGVIWAASPDPSGSERIERSDAQVSIETGRYRYVYHVVMDLESLFDLRTDPSCLENLTTTRPEAARKLRVRLQKRLGVENLGVLRVGARDQIGRLKALGYL